LYKDLAHITLVTTYIGGSKKIQPLNRLRAQVHPDLAGPGKCDRLLLYDLPGGIDQLQQITSRLAVIELEDQAIGDRVGINTIADQVPLGGIAGVKDQGR